MKFFGDFGGGGGAQLLKGSINVAKLKVLPQIRCLLDQFFASGSKVIENSESCLITFSTDYGLMN